MQVPHYPWSVKTFLSGRPTIRHVLELSEENYRRLLTLAPDLRGMHGAHVSSLGEKMDLHLGVFEQTPYTSLVHLTYYFSCRQPDIADPDAILRVYHDSQQVDVLDLSQSALPLQRWGSSPTLQQRWKINLFLSKWLAYCDYQGHRFHPTRTSKVFQKSMEMV